MCNDYEQHVAYAEYQAAIRAAELATPAAEKPEALPQADDISIG
ncbi:MAG: SOS response-associated peptidase, partial [Alphaproteobacteria bacterium]